MILRAPAPLADALAAAEARTVLPTDFKTRLLNLIAPELRLRATFTATGTHAGHVGLIDSSINRLLTGESDRATQRLGIKQLLDSLSYNPTEEERGTLTDLSTDRRINLQLDQNVRILQGAGRELQGNDPRLLDAFPAQELIRARDTEKQRDWAARWTKAGGTFFGDRMIALKDDAVWDRLGSTALFDDGLDNRWPPFAHGSGMEVQDISRSEAIELGLIDLTRQVAPSAVDLTDDLKVSPDVRRASLQEAIIADLAAKEVRAEFVGGVLRYLGPIAAANAFDPVASAQTA